MYLVSDADLLTGWTIGLVLTVVVVLIVVVLLVTILVAARRILAAAVRCLHAVERIRGNTEPLQELATTRAVARQLEDAARTIKKHAEVIASALEATEHPAHAQQSRGERS